VVHSPRSDASLLEAVDEASLAPEEIVRVTIYERLRSSYQLKREETPEKIEAFHRPFRACSVQAPMWWRS